MTELYPTLVELFGTISAISVAYLVLLHEQAQNAITISRKLLVMEIESAIHCPNTQTHGGLPDSENVLEKLKDDCRHETVAIADAEKLLTVLRQKVVDLRKEGIERVDDTEAGKRTKIARHIEKYHVEDMDRVLKRYRKSESFYSEFPERSAFAIAIPLLICGYFILVQYFGAASTGKFGFFNLVVALGGLCFVFFHTQDTLRNLAGRKDDAKDSEGIHNTESDSR